MKLILYFIFLILLLVGGLSFLINHTKSDGYACTIDPIGFAGQRYLDTTNAQTVYTTVTLYHKGQMPLIINFYRNSTDGGFLASTGGEKNDKNNFLNVTNLSLRFR